MFAKAARRAAARSVNALMTASYWEIGRRIVEFEQGGEGRAEYGEALIRRLASDLTRPFGRGFGAVNLSQMRRFYLAWPAEAICQTPSGKFIASPIFQTVSEKSQPLAIRQAPSDKSAAKAIAQTPSGQSFDLATLAARFPLPWASRLDPQRFGMAMQELVLAARQSPVDVDLPNQYPECECR